MTHPENDRRHEPEAIEAVQRFRRQFGSIPDPENPLHVRWLCTQLTDATRDRLIDEALTEMVEGVLNELVLEGRAEVVGTSADGGLLYGKVDG